MSEKKISKSEFEAKAKTILSNCINVYSCDSQDILTDADAVGEYDPKLGDLLRANVKSIGDIVEHLQGKLEK